MTAYRKPSFFNPLSFDGVGADALEAELTRIAPRYPVFRILPEA